MKMEVEYVFENGEMSKESAVSNDKDGTTQYYYEFSDYKRDEKGNWISRQVQLTTADGLGTNEKTKNYTETREIKYWN